ncbi:hypothetical protein [Actinoplanes sp. NPDC049681]|uniref:hypothetical protein n=1 Tax=Actinoplanes sp. NPDC049681 TaxID=3363905 RepID=UPI0037980F04
MLIMVVMTVMTALVVTSTWLGIKDWTRNLAEDRDDPPMSMTVPETLEGVLVRQVIDHEITGQQYRNAMHRLAERDADLHPLPGLPDDSPPR